MNNNHLSISLHLVTVHLVTVHLVTVLVHRPSVYTVLHVRLRACTCSVWRLESSKAAEIRAGIRELVLSEDACAKKERPYQLGWVLEVSHPFI